MINLFKEGQQLEIEEWLQFEREMTELCKVDKIKQYLKAQDSCDHYYIYEYGNGYRYTMILVSLDVIRDVVFPTLREAYNAFFEDCLGDYEDRLDDAVALEPTLRYKEV